MNSIFVSLYSISSVLFAKQSTVHVVVLVVGQNAPMCEYVHLHNGQLHSDWYSYVVDSACYVVDIGLV